MTRARNTNSSSTPAPFFGVGPGRSLPRILVVDDDPNIPRAVQIRFSGRFVLEVASGYEEALERIAESGVYEVILSDMHMPGIGGPALFEQVEELCPDTARILMSARKDSKKALRAVRRGRLFRFIEKPWWKGDELAKALTAGVAEYRHRRARRTLLHETLNASKEAVDELLSTKRMLKVEKLLPGQLLLENIESEDGLLLVAVGSRVTPTMIESLRIYAESVQIRESIVVGPAEAA